ncbi:MAG: TrkA family potassium uptake protein [Clostridia bacterium]|nr:TrkA family potassium uptake protein [Clostridia bacterium]
MKSKNARTSGNIRSILVIGAGRFGNNLAINLANLGNEVMVIDINEDAINAIAPYVTKVQIGDCLDINGLRQLGVHNFDICFVCISQNFQASMEITAMLKELGAQCVVSKTDRDIHADLLRRIGADDVVYPEKDMARRTAMKYSALGAFDYIQLSSEYAIMEILVPKSWVGCALKDLGVRARHNVNIIGNKENGAINPIISAEHVFQQDEHLIVAGEHKNIINMINQ